MITRKQNRLKNFDYSANGGYFVTICSKDKKNIFGTVLEGENKFCTNIIALSKHGQIVKECIDKIPAVYPSIVVDKYVIMPNHIHLILIIGQQNGRMISSPTISTVVGQMKRKASVMAGESLWQRSFYDHVIRNDNDYAEIWKYIDTNLLKWKEDCFYN